MNDLKACPFCGEEPSINSEGEVYCTNPNCWISYIIATKKDKWNTRKKDG